MHSPLRTEYIRIQQNTAEYNGINRIQQNTTKYHGIQWNTMKCSRIPQNTTEIQRNTTEYNRLQQDTLEYNKIQSNTTEYNRIQRKPNQTKNVWQVLILRSSFKPMSLLAVLITVVKSVRYSSHVRRRWGEEDMNMHSHF